MVSVAQSSRLFLAPIPQSILMLSFSSEALASKETIYARSKIKLLAYLGVNAVKAELNKRISKEICTARKSKSKLNIMSERYSYTVAIACVCTRRSDIGVKPAMCVLESGCADAMRVRVLPLPGAVMRIK